MGADRGQNWVDSKTRYIIGVAVGRTSLRFEEASTTRPLKGNGSSGGVFSDNYFCRLTTTRIAGWCRPV